MLFLGSCNCAQAQGTATTVPRQLQPAAELRTYSQHVVFKILPLLTSLHTLIEIAHGTITVDEDIAGHAEPMFRDSFLFAGSLMTTRLARSHPSTYMKGFPKVFQIHTGHRRA